VRVSRLKSGALAPKVSALGTRDRAILRKVGPWVEARHLLFWRASGEHYAHAGEHHTLLFAVFAARRRQL